MNSHPFGDLITQYLSRKHGLSQNKLAEGILQDPAVISRMCRGERLSGPQARERVVSIIGWLYEHGALTTVGEANNLLEAAGLARLNDYQPEEARLLGQLVNESGVLTEPLSKSEHTPTSSLGFSPSPSRLSDDCPPLDEPERPIVGPPILCPRHFFGRETELKLIFDFLRRSPLHHVALIGPRRSGKTSLLRYIMKITRAIPPEVRPEQRTDWLPEPHQYRWVLVDFQDARMQSRATLLPYLLTALKLPIPQPCNLENFMNAMTGYSHTPIVILLDEIGAGLASPELDLEFWYSLRALVNATNGKLGYVLASHKIPSQQAEDYGKPSPFFNIFYTRRLGPLTDAAARELVNRWPLESTDVDWVLEQSGYWPFLLQILCDIRLRSLEDGEISDGWQQEGLDQIEPYRYLLETKHP